MLLSEGTVFQLCAHVASLASTSAGGGGGTGLLSIVTAIQFPSATL